MSGELTALVIAIAGFIVLRILKWIKNSMPDKEKYHSVRQIRREEGWRNQDDGG